MTPTERVDGAARVDVCVAGTSLQELIVALDCISVGLRVAVIEGDAPNDELPSHGEYDSDGVLASVLNEVATPLTESQSAPDTTVHATYADPERFWVRARSGGYAPLPTGAVYGIPTTPLAAETLALLGLPGALRAYLDRITPLLTIGKERRVAMLVRSRVGVEVLQRLVVPVVRHRYGVDADTLDVAVLAPGLNETMTRTGTLTGAALAYRERFVARERRLAPAAGWSGLSQALVQRLRLYDARFLSGPTIRAGYDSDAEEWTVDTAADERVRAAAFVTARAAEIETGPGDSLPIPTTQRSRATAKVSVERPAWWPDACDGSVLLTTPDRGAGVWTCAVTPVDDGFCADLRGPVGSDSGADAAFVEALLHEWELVSCEAAGGESAGPRVVKTGVPAADEEAVAEFDAQQSELAATWPSLILCPSDGADGALARTVHSARDRAIVLRRHLAGIV